MTKARKNTTLPQYTTALQDLWTACEDLFDASSNKLSEIYRLASLVNFFAKQALKVQALRDALAAAKEHKDISELRRIKYKAERYTEEKCFETVLDFVCERYDAIIKAFTDESSNDSILFQIPTAEEIVKRAETTMRQSLPSQEIDKLVQIVQAEIDL